MNCDNARDLLSADRDGESGSLLSTPLREHLQSCAGCRRWLADLELLDAAVARAAETGPPAGFTEAVLRSVADEMGAVGRWRRETLWLRAGLCLVAAVQLLLAVPVLLFGHDHNAPVHVAHELGAFDASVALGLLAAARRPRLAGGMVPLVAVITALLMVTAGSDLAAGRTDVLDEFPHLLTLVGAVLLRRLSAREQPPPGAGNGLLVPMGRGGRPGVGPALGMPMATTRALAGRATALVQRLRPAPARAAASALRRLSLLGALVVAMLGAAAGPASAHVVHQGDDPTNWRTTVTGIRPTLPGVTARSAEAGQRIGLTNASGGPVVVLGFYGEPFLQLSSDTVSANTASKTAHTVYAHLPGHATESAATPAAWHVVGHGTTWWWHDPRTHFTDAELPLEVTAHPTQQVHYQDWTVGLVSDGRTATLTGSLDWLPARPSPLPWLVGRGAGAAGLGHRVAAPLVAPLAVALTALTVLDVVHAWASVSGRVGSVADRLSALPGTAA